MAELTPYSDYQDSGIPWMGYVPAHWDVLRAKYIFREVDERSSTGAEELLSVSHLTGVTPRSEKNVTMFKAESYVGHKICRPNDLVINTMWAWMAALGVAKHTGLVSPSYAVYRPLRRNASSPEYLDYLLRTSTYVNEYVRRSTGIRTSRLRLYPEKFLDIPIICPPHAEQERMVTYLRRQNRLVRRYIRAKRKLIALLEEQKQAIIQRAVTRGLDPSVRLKPSGMGWLGKIPEHWDIRRIKTLCSMQSGAGITSSSIETSGDYPVWGGNGVRGYTCSYTHEGDFILIGRQGALCGNIHIARGRFWASEHAVVTALRAGHSLEWFAAVLLAMNLNQYSIAAAQPGLAVERILNLSLPVPPLPEQVRIAEHMESETLTIAKAIDRAHHELSLIREYSTRLIADVVTGKLDVRQAAANLPDEAEELEDWDLDEAEEGNGADLGESGTEAGDEH